MNKAFKLLSISISIATLMIAPAVQGQRGVLGEILHRMDEHNKALVSLKADVRMEKVNIQLRETDINTGRTSYIPKTKKKPMYVRVDWMEPVAESLVIQGDSYEFYRPRLKQYYVGKVNSVQGRNKVPGDALAFMSMSRKQLTANYVVYHLGEETIGGAKTWHLELNPKAKTSYKSAELWVDSTGMPIQARIIEKNNDTTTILLSNLQKNVNIKSTDFKLNVPKGIKPLRG